MGVTGLTQFIESNFHGWQLKEIKGNLVIDGYSLCHHLYTFDWAQGGQYPEYREAVIDFFQSLRKSGINPVVVWDGIDYTGKKEATILRRRKENIKRVHSRVSKDETFEFYGGVLPVFASKVFKKALTELRVPMLVVDGEADFAIFQLANHYSCPVLAIDSDYYMFNLKGGYIPTTYLNLRASPITAKVFHLRAFAEQFEYADAGLRLIIPAIVGNDFHGPFRSRQFDAHICESVLLDGSKSNALLPVVRYAGMFASLEDFLSHVTTLEHLRFKDRLLDNCQKSKELYDSEVTRNLDQLRETTELRKKSGEDIPDWLIQQFHIGQLSSFAMNSLVLEKCIPHLAIDDTKSDSVYVVSQRIRQYIYGLLGVESVVEHLRQGVELARVPVCAIDSLDGKILPRLEDVVKLSCGEKTEMLYLMLGCDPVELDKLPEEWRLVVASVIFWTVSAHIPGRLVKALLLCLLLCSTQPPNLSEMRKSFKIWRDFRHSPKWMATVYAFSQWQCCYYAAYSLSELLIQPLQCVSPAFLYDGRIAVYFSTFHERKPLPRYIDGRLYRRLIGAVTAHTSTSSKPTPMSSRGASLPKSQKRAVARPTKEKTGSPKKKTTMASRTYTYSPQVEVKNRFAGLDPDLEDQEDV